MKINIEGIDYELDVQGAKNGGVLTKVPVYPLNTGDVYISQECSPFLLIKPFWNGQECILLGRSGLRSYSNSYLQKILSPQEATDELVKGGYKFSHNINGDVIKAIHR